MPSRQCQRNSRRDLLKRPKKKRPTQKTAPASKKRTKTRRTEALVIPQRTTRLTTTLAIVSMIASSALFSSTAQATETINYGVQPATQPIYIARVLGRLDPIEKKHDVAIEFRGFSYGAPENQALAAGESQITSASMGPAIVASARLPAKLIAISILEQTAILVPKDSALTSIKDLKGKQVAFPGEGSQQYPLPLKADDNPKFDASFAEKALAAK